MDDNISKAKLAQEMKWPDMRTLTNRLTTHSIFNNI